MLIKKLTFCVLCLANAVNLATEEDFNEENSSNSKVEENINKNNWNTRKWGSIYIFFPAYLCILYLRFVKVQNLSPLSCCKKLIFHFLPLLAVGVKYQYLFHKNCGINIALSLGNVTDSSKDEKSFECSIYFLIHITPSIEYIYKRKGKHIFSGSFSFTKVSWEKKRSLFEEKTESHKLSFYIPIFVNFCFFQYEYNRALHLNYGKFWFPLLNNLLNLKASIEDLKKELNKKFFSHIVMMFLININIELNIIGLNDLRKKRKKNIDLI